MKKFYNLGAWLYFRQGKMVDKEKITSVGIPKYMKKQEEPAEETQEAIEVNFIYSMHLPRNNGSPVA